MPRMKEAYSRRLAGTDVEGEAWDVARVAHEDCSCDLLLRGGRNGDGSVRETLVGVTSTAVGIVHDLTTL